MTRLFFSERQRDGNHQPLGWPVTEPTTMFVPSSAAETLPLSATSGLKAHIVLALPSLGIGGAETVNISLAQAFLDMGHRVDVVTGWIDRESRVALPVPKGARHIL